MKLKLASLTKHTEIVSCVGYTGNNELYSISDDKSILKWTGDGEFLGNIQKFEPPDPSKEEGASGGGGGVTNNVYATDFKWFPPPPGKGQTVADTYVIGGTDGKIYICSKTGKIDKIVDAHQGAVLCLRWNYEGSALVSGGEDGIIKIWSRSGMLRSTLVKTNTPIYCVAWSSDNNQCLYTNGKNLAIKSLQPGNKPFQWKAHDGLILKADWNMVNNLIISCGEDKKYKVWDTFGRKLYASTPFEHPLTSISWSPNGEMFAIGSFNLIGICDKLGWCHSIETPQSGSLFDIAWTPDGTQLACAGGSGAVIFGHILNRRYDWKHYQVTVLEDHKVLVYNVLQDSTENLEFRDRVIKCYIYNERNWNTPIIIDLSNNGRVTCIQQCSDYFVLCDTFVGIQVYSYDGRLVSQPKYPGMRGEFMTPQNISISSDVLAVKDHNNEKCVYLFDIKTARMIGDGPLKHTMDITEIALNNQNYGSGRLLAIIDKNRDFYLTKTIKPILHKLGPMVETFAWNDDNDLLIAIMDTNLVVWFYPSAVFVDEDVAPQARTQTDGGSYGRNAQITSFNGTNCVIRKSDGAIVQVAAVTPYAGILQDFSKKKQWENAIRLCRHVKIKEMWAALAAMSLAHQDLNTAEVAFAAIDEIHKVQYVCYIRDIPSSEGRAAELALLRKQPFEAEGILLAANLIYRCIRMWIDLYHWDHALELAIKYKSHVDTVLYFRGKYLRALGKQEENNIFLQYSSVPVDYLKIKQKISVELVNERDSRGGSSAVLATT